VPRHRINVVLILGQPVAIPAESSNLLPALAVESPELCADLDACVEKPILFIHEEAIDPFQAWSQAHSAGHADIPIPPGSPKTTTADLIPRISG
tara:strand:+ start:14422 stop:14703 length:282 start_codon:yes stop_codon:yes gene_type:complete